MSLTKITLCAFLACINSSLLAKQSVPEQKTIELKPAPSIINYQSAHHPVVAENGMVVSRQYLASQVGRQILQKGGNAVDAAIATGFALSVVLPVAGNIGGGGFMLVHMAETGETIAIDYREMAPANAHKDLFLDADGNVDNQKARFSYLSVGVPGTVAGFELAHKKYGKLAWKELLQPAIDLAENGFYVNWDIAQKLERRRTHLTQSTATKKAFYKEDGTSYQLGETLKQQDLAWSLKQIQKEGAKAFYHGKIADKIVRNMEVNGGIISRKDLANYRPKIRSVIKGSYRGYDIVTMPLPSSGGVHIVQMLNVLEHFPMNEYGVNTAKSIRVMTETMKRAYADRSKHLGDSDFYDAPVEWLISKDYAKSIATEIQKGQVTPSKDILPGTEPAKESDETTQFSVVDKWGNAVSNTYTLNYSFGSGLMVEGTGILLNNEMDDFSAKPGAPNGYGLIGGEANAIEANKRPLSSMTPTMVFKDGKVKLITGSPGGSRIINAVLQIIVNVIDHNMNIAAATHTPRFHHQWLPDALFVEPEINQDTVNILENMGYKVRRSGTIGATQSIQIEDYIYGSADPRRPNAEASGY
ncbi:MAG: gamma-glutamyltransferase [Gammaproteobacteria bacterium]|nr:gamma-glutamyltransferase [Gammaproteobacteria bacterium]